MRRRLDPIVAGALAVVLLLAVIIGAAAALNAPSSAQASPATPSASIAPPTAVARASGPSGSPDARSNVAAEMLAAHNALRDAIGAALVRPDERVTAAAQRHAEYLVSSGALVGHDETPGGVGFTGATVRDRLAAQGYPDASASEVAISGLGGTDGVRALWLLPYHRIGLMHPHAMLAGWGHAENAGRISTVGVIVYDFASPAAETIHSPATNEKVTPSWDGDEVPDPLPAGAGRPVGYPIVLMSSGAAVQLRAAHLTDARGGDVPMYVVPQAYETDYAAVVPRSPLTAQTRYRVKLEVTIAGKDIVDEWEFETERG